MADPIGPTADNLKIAQQLLSAMSQISVQLENQTKAYRAQADLVESLCKAQECFGKVDSNKIKAVSDGLKTAQENTKSFSDELVNTEAEAEKLRSKTAELAAEARKVLIADEFKAGLQSGLNLTKALFGSLMRIGSTGLSGIMGIGKALLSIPGNILNFFQSNAGGGTDPWREALEELRDKFGSLQVGTSKAVLGMMNNVNQFNDSGLRLGRVFGYGRAGAAAAMKEFMKVAEEMGPMAMRFMDATKGVSGQLLVLTKSTGLTGDALRSLQISADNGGESVATAVQKMSVELVRAQRTFGISVKEMGRDLEVMMKDVGTFGVMSRDTMIKTSVYARKLGLSMEALKKVMDKTLNFEDTANMAGGLAEAFNMNIDAMKMMKAQTPAEKLDQLREAFFRTGKNIDQMSIAERKHLSNLTGLSEEETRIAFAQKNRALTGAAVDAQMKKSQKTQITQEQAMHELADSIKRLTQSGSGMKGGFFDTFFKGFEAGMLRTREFRKVSREIQRDMRIVYRAGVDVGRMFVHYFPGIKQVLDALGDMFAPAKFRRMMNSVKNIFAIFFIDLQRDPKAGVQNFMKNMKKAFFSFFDSNSGAGRSFLDGMKKFWKAFGAIAVEGLRFGIESIRDAAKGITGFLKNPRSFMEGASKAGSGISGAIAQAISYAYKELWPVMKEAGIAVGEMLMTVLTDYVGPFLRRHAVAIGATLFGMIFGPAFIRAGIAALLGGGGGGIFSAIAGAVGRVFNFTGGADAADKKADEQRTVAQSFQNTLKNTARSASGILLGITALAGIMYILMPAFTALLSFINSNNITAANIGVALLAVAGMTALIVGIEKVKFLDSLTKLGDAAKAGGGNLLLGALAALAALVLVGGAAIVVIETFSVYNESQVKTAMIAMYAMTGLFFVMVPLIGALAIIGALLPVVGVAAIGMLAIAPLMTKIGEKTIEIVRLFNGIPTEQVSTATNAIKNIINVYSVIANSMVSMGLLAIIRPSTILSIVDKITTLVRQISVSVVDMIRSIDLSGDVNLLKAKAEVFSAALLGIAAIVTPITNFGKALAENDSIFDSGEMERIVVELSHMMTAMFSGIQNIVREIGALNLGTDPGLMKSKAEVFSVVLNGIAAIITPISTFGSTIGTAAGGFFSNSADVTRTITELGISMPIILRSIGTLATTLLTQLNAITASVDPVKLKSVAEVLMYTLKSVMDVVITLMSVFSGGRMATGAGIGGAIGSFAGPVGAVVGTVIGQTIAARADQQEFQRKISGITAIFSMLKNNLKDVIEAVTVPMGVLLSSPNITADSLKAVAALGDIMKGIGNILVGIGGAAAALPRNPTSPRDLGRITLLLDVITPFIKGLTDRVIEVIQSFTVFNAAQIDSLNSVTPILSVFFGFISSFTGIIYNAMEMMKGKSPDEMNRIAGTIVHFINTLSNQTQNMMRGIPALVLAISSIDLSGIDPNALAGKITSVKAVLDLVGSISAATKGIQDVAQAKLGAADMAAKIVQPIVDLLLTMFTDINADGVIGLGNSLRFALNALSEFTFPRGLTAKIASMKSLFELIKTISDAAASLNTLGGAGAQTPMRADVMNIPLSNLAIMINSLKSKYIFFGGTKHYNPLSSPGEYFGPLAAMLPGITGKGALLTNIKNIVTEMLSSAKSIAEQPIVPPSPNLGTSLANMTSVLGTIDSYFGPAVQEGSINNLLDNIHRNTKGRVSHDLSVVVERYNSLSRDLARMNAIDIDASLTRLNDGLGRNRVVQIENAAANITINLDVKLRTEDIETALFTRSNKGAAPGPGGSIARANFVPQSHDTAGH